MPSDSRHIWLAPVVVLAFAAGAMVGWSVRPTPGQTVPAECREITARTFKVQRVIDGDSFVIAYDGEPTGVRVLGINASERKDPGGPEATAALKELIGGKAVRLDFAGKRKRDNFGRLLCRVYVGSVDVGAEMVRRGQCYEAVP